ncbi:hypothetical protein [Photobacterium damselae]|uniref:hypothetical protein n=1 Tax=Photobacterium damselae TaxID=38293 RepID=UPI0025436CD8
MKTITKCLLDITEISDTNTMLALLPTYITCSTNNEIKQLEPLYAILELIQKKVNEYRDNESLNLPAIRLLRRLIDDFYNPDIAQKGTLLVLIGIAAGGLSEAQNLNPLVMNANKIKQSQKSGTLARCEQEECNLLIIHHVAIDFYGEVSNHQVRAGTFCKAIHELFVDKGVKVYQAKTLRKILKDRNAFPEKSLENGRGKKPDIKLLKKIIKKHTHS